MSMKIHDICGACGCCLEACPTGAIDVLPHKTGYRQPYIKTDKCVECGECRAVCPMDAIH